MDDLIDRAINQKCTDGDEDSTTKQVKTIMENAEFGRELHHVNINDITDKIMAIED